MRRHPMLITAWDLQGALGLANGSCVYVKDLHIYSNDTCYFDISGGVTVTWSCLVTRVSQLHPIQVIRINSSIEAYKPGQV